MEKKDAINQFLGEIENEPNEEEDENVKKTILDEREGLVERIDRIFVTRDGKQLLREQY